MTVYRDKKEPLTQLSYSEAFWLGGKDYLEGQPRRVTRPRNSNASAGRFGYSDGYDDAMAGTECAHEWLLEGTACAGERDR